MRNKYQTTAQDIEIALAAKQLNYKFITSLNFGAFFIMRLANFSKTVTIFTEDKLSI